MIESDEHVKEVDSLDITLSNELTQKSSAENHWLKFSFYIIAGTIALLYGVLPLLAALFSKGPAKPIDAANIPEKGMLLSLLFSQFPIILILLIISFCFCRSVPLADKFRFKNWQWWYLLVPFPFEVILLFSVYLITIAFHAAMTLLFEIELPPRDLQVFLLYCSNQTLALMAVGAVIIAPVIEELMFRKVIFDYVDKHTGRIASVIITSALFSAVHFTLIQSPALFVIGVVLQILYIYTKSIYASIFLHVVHNGTAFLLIIIARLLMGNEFFRSIIEQGL